MGIDTLNHARQLNEIPRACITDYAGREPKCSYRCLKLVSDRDDRRFTQQGDRNPAIAGIVNIIRRIGLAIRYTLYSEKSIGRYPVFLKLFAG